MKKYIFILLAFLIGFTGCEDLLSPIDDNHRTLDDIYDDAVFAEGLIINAYARIPNRSYSFSDVATDDAVTNDKFNGFLRIATGQWSSINNPLEQWNNSYTVIMYLNQFLEEADKVEWSYTSEIADQLFQARNMGEAYGLRALFMYYLVQAHTGYGTDGRLLGVPIITSFSNAEEQFNKPRNTFEECIQQIYRDLNKAAEMLPLDFIDLRNELEISPAYAYASVEEYNRVFGNINKQRLSGRIVEGIRSKVALLAASPAYADGSTTTWADAANYAAKVLEGIGGISGLDPTGHLFYTPSKIDEVSLAAKRDIAEALWRGSLEGGSGSNYLERNNFPPSLFGNGRVNPTQNLVDAFPMLNGYPITDAANSGFNPSDPYANRDPRLKDYILVNGEPFAGKTIMTQEGSGDDAVNYIKTSTRTGYYMKKLMRDDVSLDPTAEQSKKHYYPYIRYTEIFLNYAEAANEAWGPDATGPGGYSARDVVAAIRNRAGINQPDAYLVSITTKEEMRSLIHNERRLELCFEGFRFWDLRRWKENINTDASGVKITNGTYDYSTVEKRLYDDYMYYPPIPYNEVLKANLVQNAGW